MEGTNHLWNVKNLQPPPVSTYKVNTPTDVGALSCAFQDAVSFFVNLKHLHAEAAMLSRTIYRMKMKYRSDKGFKYLLKLNRCLLQYLGMDFGKTITMFSELIPKTKMVGVYMPSRNMLDYILVRLQGLTMLLSRINETSQLTAYFMEYKITYGDYWKMALVILSVTSRIWFIAKTMLKFCYRFYLDILPFRVNMEVLGPQWIPDNYQFPDNLETWLMKHQALETNKYEGKLMLRTKSKLVQRFYESQSITLTSDSTESSTDFISKDEDFNNKNKNNKSSNNFYLMMQNADIGQVVSRLEQNKNDLTDNVKNVLRNDKEILVKENIIKVNETKTDRSQGKNELIADGQHQIKTNILNDYFEAKRRIQTLTLGFTKVNESNCNNYNSLAEKNNSQLMETEVILSNQCESSKVESPKTEITFFIENNLQNVKQKALVKINKKQLKHKIRDVEKIDNILESINSASDLNNFLKRQVSARNNMKKCLTSKLDRLQWHMLEKEIKKCIKKANKVTASKEANSEDYLLRAKNLLKVSLS